MLLSFQACVQMGLVKSTMQKIYITEKNCKSCQGQQVDDPFSYKSFTCRCACALKQFLPPRQGVQDGLHAYC